MAAGVLGALCLAHTAYAGEEGVSEGALLASMCDTCHGVGGAGARPNPPIQGIDVAEFVDLLKAFASGEEQTTIMQRHAKGYTDAQIDALAAHYKNQAQE